MQEHKSEIARLRERIELEYQAAQRGLTGYACVSQHEFITARMENMSQCHEELKALVGPQEAIRMLAETLEKL
ncbi:MAG TPA: hypothetical protein VFQ30_03330 [Ktedonobacteraceae bacterium]|nr:hypothetical protein [Ktedonobacteraceae bacterium]